MTKVFNSFLSSRQLFYAVSVFAVLVSTSFAWSTDKNVLEHRGAIAALKTAGTAQRAVETAVHNFSLNIEPEKGVVHVIDKVTFAHPGGAATAWVQFGKNVRFFQALWSGNRLPVNVRASSAGTEVSVALPYMPVPDLIEISVCSDWTLSTAGNGERRKRHSAYINDDGSEHIVLSSLNSIIPSISVYDSIDPHQSQGRDISTEEDSSVLRKVNDITGNTIDSVKLRLPEGWDLVASSAPLARAQGRDGATLVKFGKIPEPESFSVLAGYWLADTVKESGYEIEVASVRGDYTSRALKTMKNLVSVLSGKSFSKGTDCLLKGILPATGRSSFSMVVDPLYDISAENLPGLSIVRPSEPGLTLTTSELYEAALDLIINSCVKWDRSVESGILRKGFVEFSIVNLLKAAGKARLVEKRLAAISSVLEKTRPSPKWKRWRKRQIPERERGFGFFHMLSALVGDEMVKSILRDFLETASLRDMSAAAYFQMVVRKNTGRNFNWLFSSYLVDGFLPDFVVEEAKVLEQRRPVNLLYDHYGRPSDSGRYTTELRLGQVGEMKFRGKVDLLIETDTDRYNSEVDFDSARQTVKIITSRPPRKITVDPDRCFFDCRGGNNVLKMYESKRKS